MEEEDALFGPSMKKKKKKTGFKIDAVIDGSDSVKDKSDKANGDVPPADDELFSLPTKKKKKKSATFNLDDMGEAVDQAATEDTTTGGDLDNDLEFDYTSKKKKSKKRVDIEDLISDNKKEASEEKEKADAWGDSERDYSYEELLTRAFDMLREKNPDMVSGEKKKFTMKPPQVLRIGSKKSAFANFTEICKLLHRMPTHVLQFLLAELGTSGSIDGNHQLIIKGRFQQKQIENVLRRYIKEYVTCHTCRSSDTILQKDARLYFLQCEQCNSRCSVQPIKSGFQAVANKQQRQAMRAGNN